MIVFGYFHCLPYGEHIKIEGFGREASPNREKLYERLLKNPRLGQNKEVCPLRIKGILKGVLVEMIDNVNQNTYN